MKKLLLLVMLMCAFTIAPASAKDTATKTKTVKGCIHKDGDNIWLKTRPSSYHLMSKTDLSAHDGHEVKVTGAYSKGPLGNDKDVKHLEVSNVEMVADHCAMGTKKMPKEAKESKK